MSPNFGALLNKTMGEVERPKPLPQGTYVAVVKGLPKFDKSTKKGTEYAEFTLQPIQAYDDVDQEALTAMGGFADKTVRDTYYLTEASLWRLKDFLEACGIEEEGTLQAAIEQTPGKQVAITIKHTASEDGKAVYANVGGVAKVD